MGALGTKLPSAVGIYRAVLAWCLSMYREITKQFPAAGISARAAEAGLKLADSPDMRKPGVTKLNFSTPLTVGMGVLLATAVALTGPFGLRDHIAPEIRALLLLIVVVPAIVQICFSVVEFLRFHDK